MEVMEIHGGNGHCLLTGNGGKTVPKELKDKAEGEDDGAA